MEDSIVRLHYLIDFNCLHVCDDFRNWDWLVTSRYKIVSFNQRRPWQFTTLPHSQCLPRLKHFTVDYCYPSRRTNSSFLLCSSPNVLNHWILSLTRMNFNFTFVYRFRIIFSNWFSNCFHALLHCISSFLLVDPNVSRN